MPSPCAQGASFKRCARIPFFDTLRGFTIISMVLFHACYDAAFIYGIDIPWFTQGPFQDVWRASISWTFLFLAGWMTSFSRSNPKRAVVYAVAAFGVAAVTSLAAVDMPVNFGILFCMAASTVCYCAFTCVLDSMPGRIPPALIAGACIALFAATYHLYGQRFTVEGLAWLGFPSPAFASGDYYPLIPFTFLYLAGAFAARWHRGARGGGYPIWMRTDWCPALTWIGTKSLAVYLIHQPLVMGILSLLTRADVL